MRIPLSWIKEYIHIENTPEEIAKMLTMAGIEVDSYETIGSSFNGVVAATVVHVEKHPDADKLVVAKVRVGDETFQVVCGAPNCREGIITAFAPVGATLDDGAFTIKKSKLRGVDSFGMLCAADELQLSKEKNEGIMELPSGTKEGTPLKDLFGDTIFEISLTPNLGHCASVLGIARELSAATGLHVLRPLIALGETNEPVQKSVEVKIIDIKGCPRYTCRVIQNVKVGPSPHWLKTRLEKCGLRSINNVVDVTNYVLLELGHPLHAFDLDRIEEKKIIVRKADDGEMFKTLDGKERTLKATDLVIADPKRPVAIAGVMGGLNSEVHEGTQHIALESAYFDPIAIRKTSKHLGLQSDSSKRFERGTDPNGLVTSLDRATQLIQKVAGGNVLKGIVDIKYTEFPPLNVPCRLSRISGRDLQTPWI
jgi:phenylalanyl-tRNA synthetase beta chain